MKAEFKTTCYNLLPNQAAKGLHFAVSRRGLYGVPLSAQIGFIFYTAAWDGTVRKWLVPPQDVQELIEWVSANRYIPELSPEQRARYLLESSNP